MPCLSSFFFTLFIVLSISLCGCGGGGGGGSSDPPPPSDSLLPTANAGNDITVDVAEGAIDLDGTGSYDPEGADLTFTWTTPDGSLLTGATPVFSFSTPGIYPITLIVNDGDADSAPDIVTVTVADRIVEGDFLDIENFREVFFVEGAADGGFYLLGTIADAADSDLNDIYLQKIARDGTVVTEHIFEIPNSQDYPSDLVEIRPGVVAVVGTVDDEVNVLDGDLFIAIADMNVPEIIYSDTVHRSGNDNITSIRRTDSGFLICGSTFDGNVRKMRLLNYNYDFDASQSSGILWDVLLDTPGSGGFCIDILSTNTNEVMILGEIYTEKDEDIYLAKVDVSNPQAAVIKNDLRVSGSTRDLALALEETDSGYLAIGSTNSYGLGGYDILALRVDSDLTYSGEISDYTIGGGGNDFSVYVRRLTPTTNGFLVAGATQSGDYNGILLALDHNGQEQNLGVYDFGNGSDEVALFARETGGNYELVGISGLLDFESSIIFEMGSPDFFSINIDPASMLIQSQ